MKIVQVLVSSGFGGAERLFVDLCNGMARRGHNVLAICPDRFQGLSLLDTKADIIIENVDSRWDRNLFAENKIRRAVKAFNADVVHTHLARTASLTGAALKNASLPVIANMHNYVKLKYYKNIKHFVPGTEHQASYFNSMGVAKQNITVIPHFSNIRKTSPVSHDFSQRKLVAFGRFVHKKGFDLLVRAVALLGQQGFDLELLLGGDGPERERLRQLVHDLSIEDRVHFSGWVEDVEFFLQKAPFFILPSRDEPFGIVVLEAMASGNCIIATRTHGPNEVLQDGNAFLCEVDDVEDMAKAIFSAMHNPEVAKHCSLNAEKKFHERYAPDVILGEYEKLFQQLITT
ncbi:glycosyltransferase family 4 protein [Desulfobotulus mexicanus]|uniref:Glycosyltransferase family 4 protein n=1 Tax=Desulfobotulus mexicanus TaxID=2586642 RepID=A0A5S5MBW8_9BACT|nr:glycosyltransferase family 4 protein [Desulfobotulus mexicanus]TYT73170.1 glycosyltransferase family 4 protein [Desulfobotulus mexicanus]